MEIDNAHKLDKDAFERMLSLRTYFHERNGHEIHRAVILVGMSENNPNQQTNQTRQRKKTLPDFLADETEAQAAYGEKIELSLLNKRSLLQAFVTIVDKELHAEFSPTLQPDLDRLGNRLLEILQRNWHILENRMNKLDVALGPRNGNRRRVITQEIFDKVFFE